MRKLFHTTKNFMRMAKSISQNAVVRAQLQSFFQKKEEEVAGPIVEEVQPVVEEVVAEQPVEVKVEEVKPKAPRKRTVKAKAETTEEVKPKKTTKKAKKKDA